MKGCMMNEISTLRLYLLRAGYLVLIIGLGMQIWPQLTVALPHWLRAQWSQDLASTTFAVSLVVIFLPLIPWPYVFDHYVRKNGDPWGRGAATAPLRT